MDNVNEFDLLQSMFLNGETLFKEIDKLVKADDISYISATIVICDKKGIEAEDLLKLKLISPLLMSKLQAEGLENGLLNTKLFATLFN